MLKRLTPLFARCTLAAALGGCAGLGTPPNDLALFDLGLADPVPVNGVARPSSVEVRAPSWLTTSAMQYRLAYAEPLRRQTYAQSRWAATPAEMLTRALDRALLVPGAEHSGCRLRVELDEFAQVFDSAERSHVLIAARATLLPQRGESPVAGRDLNLRVPAEPADAQGGVLAARAATRALAAELGTWFESLDPGGTAGLNGRAACRP